MDSKKKIATICQAYGLNCEHAIYNLNAIIL